MNITSNIDMIYFLEPREELFYNLIRKTETTTFKGTVATIQTSTWLPGCPNLTFRCTKHSAVEGDMKHSTAHTVHTFLHSSSTQSLCVRVNAFFDGRLGSH